MICDDFSKTGSYFSELWDVNSYYPDTADVTYDIIYLF